MGCVALGPRYIGPGRDHWFEMLESPRKPIAQWYPLQEHIPGISPGNEDLPNGNKHHHKNGDTKHQHKKKKQKK